MTPRFVHRTFENYERLDQLWNELNIINDIGINEESINKFSKLLMRVNGERPLAKRHSANWLRRNC